MSHHPGIHNPIGAAMEMSMNNRSHSKDEHHQRGLMYAALGIAHEVLPVQL